MTHPVRRKLIAHGLMIMLTSLVAGIGLWMSLLGGFELVPGYLLHFQLPGTPEGWARAHRGAPMNGLMLFGMAYAMSKLDLEPKKEGLCGLVMICTGWANTVFYFASNFSGNRGLSFGANSFGAGDVASVVALAPAYLFGVLSMGVIAYLANIAFNPGKSSPSSSN